MDVALSEALLSTGVSLPEDLVDTIMGVTSSGKVLNEVAPEDPFNEGTAVSLSKPLLQNQNLESKKKTMPVAFSKFLPSTGVTLPEDLVGDDTILFRTLDGKLYNEVAPEDPFHEMGLERHKKMEHFIQIGLEYYNDKHKRNYRPLPNPFHNHCLSLSANRIKCTYHTNFEASDADSVESTPNFFCIELCVMGSFAEHDNVYKAKVISCEIADGKNPLACKYCNMEALEYPHGKKINRVIIKPPLSGYSHILVDDGATLSDKAKYRLEYSALALTYYNDKYSTNYKLVDVLPQSFTQVRLIHINFIAKKNGDSPNELFFAEIDIRNWEYEAPLVQNCCIVSGKTTTACRICFPLMAKRVIHPVS